jgi:hypothetical protein
MAVRAKELEEPWPAREGAVIGLQPCGAFCSVAFRDRPVEQLLHGGEPG